MTNRQQWTLIAGVVMTAVFGVALAIKLRPQLEPVEIGSRAPAFVATSTCGFTAGLVPPIAGCM